MVNQHYVHDFRQWLESEGHGNLSAGVLKVFQRMDNPLFRPLLPKGLFGVVGWDIDSMDAPEDLKKVFDGIEAILMEAEYSFNGDSPRILKEGHERFRKNTIKMLKLSKMDPKKRKSLPLHEFPLFFDNFDLEVRNLFPYKGWFFDTTLDEMKITTDLLGRGGYAFVYLTEGDDGKKYAVKIFRTRSMISRTEKGRESIIRNILENVAKHKEVLSQEPFTQPRAVYESGGYIMDFFDGENLEEIIKKDASFKEQRDKVGLVLLTYASMLQNLHSKGMFFVDNGWSSVLLGDEGVKICDYDLVSNEVDINRNGYFARKIMRVVCASREQLVGHLPFTSISDLESFALMIDYLYIGSYLHGVIHHDAGIAVLNDRKYPKVRRMMLPKGLRDIVSPLIAYPRDELITAKDFVDAVKKEYKL